MISLNHSLVDLVKRRMISIEEAENYSTSLSELKMLMKK